MEKIAILCALNSELKFIINKLSKIKKLENFYIGKYEKLNIIAAKSGLGKIRSAATTQYIIDKFNDVRIIINFGSCGQVGDNVGIGDLVFCTKTIEYDFHTLRDFIPTTDIEYNFDSSIFEKFNLKKGILLTATQNVDSKKKKKLLYEKFNGIVADWEGAAIAQICKLNNKKVMIFKCITDRGEKNLLEDFKKSFDSVMEKSSSLLLEFLSFLNQKGYLFQKNHSQF